MDMRQVIEDYEIGIVEHVVDLVAPAFGAYREIVMGRSRIPAVSQARQTVFYILRSQYGWSLERIARRLNRHHSAVMFGLRTIDNVRATNPDFRRKLDDLAAQAPTLLFPSPASTPPQVQPSYQLRLTLLDLRKQIDDALALLPA